MAENLQVEMVYFYVTQNSKAHHTENYEVVNDPENPIPVLRRGQKFTIGLRFVGRQYSSGTDNISVVFNFGMYRNKLNM